MMPLLDPAVLFFAVGLLAGVLRSDLEVPPQVARFLSLYLLMALGLKGGFALSAGGLPADGYTVGADDVRAFLAERSPATGSPSICPSPQVSAGCRISEQAQISAIEAASPCGL